MPLKDFSPLNSQKKALEGFKNIQNARSASPSNKNKGKEIAIRTDTGEYQDIPMALEQKVETLMKARLSSLLGVKMYFSSDHYSHSLNTAQPNIAPGNEAQHRLSVEQQRSSSEIHWNKAPAVITNVSHVNRMSVFMPVLGAKRRKSLLGKVS